MPYFTRKPLRFEAICLAQDITLHYRDGREGHGRRGDYLVTSPISGDQYIVDADDMPLLSEPEDEHAEAVFKHIGLQR